MWHPYVLGVCVRGRGGIDKREGLVSKEDILNVFKETGIQLEKKRRWLRTIYKAPPLWGLVYCFLPSEEATRGFHGKLR